MTYVLDTNTFIAGLNGNATVLRRLDALNPEDIVLCAPVLAELEYGARFSGREEANLDKIKRLSSRTRFQAFGDAAARRFGTLKAELRRRGALKADGHDCLRNRRPLGTQPSMILTRLRKRRTMTPRAGRSQPDEARSLLMRINLSILLVILTTSSSPLIAASNPCDLQVLNSIAKDIESLKPSFPQLADFTIQKSFDASRPAIRYSYRTHRSKRAGGWAAGVPNPDEDGVWFYIDVHDPDSTAQIHTQPETLPTCLGDKRVSFLILEGARTKSLHSAIWKILENHGIKECAGDRAG